MDDLKQLRDELDMLLAGRMSPDERDAYFDELERVGDLRPSFLRILVGEFHQEPRFAIQAAFVWADSPQGHDYWWEIANRFEAGA